MVMSWNSHLLFLLLAAGTLYLDDFSVQKVAPMETVTPLQGGGSYSGLAAAAPAGPSPPVLPEHPGPLTTDAEMIAELNLDAPGMDKVKAAVQSGKLPAIEAAYLDYRQHISTAKWTNMPGGTQPKVRILPARIPPTMTLTMAPIPPFGARSRRAPG